ncbi:hypothetical protein ACGFX4_12765 [Kitasatospora sp. NPDC048365]|uniref:hypothetical protein n=1 Tax=Kitasatospora sp. NPDC048365 TaxID=3364050 RepID=UPI00371522B8
MVTGPSAMSPFASSPPFTLASADEAAACAEAAADPTAEPAAEAAEAAADAAPLATDCAADCAADTAADAAEDATDAAFPSDEHPLTASTDTAPSPTATTIRRIISNLPS